METSTLLDSPSLTFLATTTVLKLSISSEQVDNAGDLSEYQIQRFNEKFYKYVGEDVSAAEVNALVKDYSLLGKVIYIEPDQPTVVLTR